MLCLFFHVKLNKQKCISPQNINVYTWHSDFILSLKEQINVKLHSTNIFSSILLFQENTTFLK